MTEFSKPPNPYVGPVTFAYGDRHRYFGREREARDLLSLVIAERLTLFYAQSGAGKSSLLHTRLIPGLREQARYLVLPVGRVGGEIPQRVTTVDNIYTFNLLLSVERHKTDADPNRFAHMTLSAFLDGLRTPDGLHYEYDEATAARAAARPPAVIPTASRNQPPYVLIIDQFEEIITAHPQRWRERYPFFQQLADAMRSDPLLWVVLTLREDFVAPLDPFADLMPGRLSTRFYMERMGIDAALAAIQRPAANAGRPFTAEAAQTLVDNLCQVRVAGQEGTFPGQSVEPVQLQVVCYQLWENLHEQQAVGAGSTDGSALITSADLQQSGDVDTALADFYEQALRAALTLPGIAISERKLRIWFDEQLITAANTRGTVYRGEEETDGMSNRVVDTLQARFLLRSELRAGGTWVELVHDRFIEPIIHENRIWQASYHNPVTTAYQRWHNSGRSVTHLLRGVQLVEATSYCQTYPHELTDEEQQFVIESERQAVLELAQIRQAVRRRQFMIIATTTVIVLLSILTTWAFISSWRADKNAKEARSQALIAQAQVLQQQASLLPISMLLAIEAEQVTPSITAKELLRHGLTLLPAVLFDELAPAKITQVVFTPDGKWIASADESGVVQIRNATTGVLLQVIAQKSSVRSIDFAPGDEQRLVTASNDGQVCFWDVASGQRIGDCLSHSQVHKVIFSPDGKWLATAGDDGKACLWAVATQEQRPCTGHGYKVNDLAFSPDNRWLASADAVGNIQIRAVDNDEKVANGQYASEVLALAFRGDGQLATAGSDGAARIWTIDATTATLTELATFHHQDKVNDLAFSPDGKWLATVSDDKTARLWDVNQGREELRMYHAGWVNVVTFSPDGKWLATASVDHTARVWDAVTGQEVARMGHDNEVRTVVFSPDGRHVATGSTDKRTRVWALANPEQSRVQQQGHIWTVAYHPTAQKFATTSDKGFAVSLWNTLTGNFVEQLPFMQATARTIAFSANGQWLATGSDDRTVRVWQLANQQMPFQFTLGQAVRAVAFSPDGACLASGAVGGAAQIHPLDIYCPIRSMPMSDTITAMSYSLHGQWLATASRAGVVRIESLTSSTVVTVTHGGAPILAVAFHPDEQMLSTAGSDRTVRLWTIQSGQPALMSLLHGDEVLAVAFSPDGQWLATGSADGAARIWAVATGEEVLRLQQNRAMSAVAFSPDGAYLVTSSGKQAQVWAFRQFVFTPNSALIETVCSRLTRNLTQTEWKVYFAANPYRRTCPNLPGETDVGNVSGQ